MSPEKFIKRKYPDAECSWYISKGLYAIYVNFIDGVSDNKISDDCLTEQAAWKNAYDRAKDI